MMSDSPSPPQAVSASPSRAGLDAFIQRCQARIEDALEHHLPGPQVHPARLHQAMRYACLGGGKRIRPLLVYASGSALGAAQRHLDIAACAVEYIHTYSLVHDDLPAMDDDDLRRGRATCHKAYDEATAILVGDALQTLAFQLLAAAPELDLPALNRLQMIETLSRASGSRGLVGGQAIDLAAVGQQLDIAQLEDMHIHKTGALIRASVLLGLACAPQVSDIQRKHLDQYAKYIGLAFQIQDDILDVEGDTQGLGKTAGADQARAKPTYPTLLGLAGAKQRAAELLDAAHGALQPFAAEADPLRGLADYIVHRQR